MKEEELIDFINRETVKKWIYEYKSVQNSVFAINKFNIFQIVSDLYYRENFHSDVFAKLLTIPEVVELLIEYINIIKPNLELSKSDFIDSESITEESKIDIQLRNVKSGKVIIIENKINNAIDMFRQIPRYLEVIEKSKYKLEAIIYLTLNGIKEPNKGDWSENEKKKIETLFLNIPAYNGTDKDLNTLLEKVELRINDFNKIMVIRQYRELIKKISSDAMNGKQEEIFYEMSLKEDNLQKFKMIAETYNKLPKIRANQILERFKGQCKPFDSVSIWKDFIAYFNRYKVDEKDFAIDIVCRPNEYSVQVFDRNEIDGNKNVIDLLNKINSKDWKDTEDKRRVYYTFNFPEQENEMYEFVGKLILDLNSHEIDRQKSIQNGK